MSHTSKPKASGSKTNISDYSGYNYKKEFWENTDRQYEDICERKTLISLLTQIKRLNKKNNSENSTKTNPPKRFLDAGCGFGRLFSSYEPYSDEFYLLDYAQHLLDEAKATLSSTKALHFIQGSFFDMPFDDNTMDTIISLRTLHHVETPELFINEIYRVLKPGGYFIFEIPNKRHLINIIRYFLGNRSLSPFNTTPLKLNDAFYNFSFDHITSILGHSNFTIIKTIDTSFFRSTLIKSLFPAKLLVFIDLIFQRFFSWTHLTPSIYILCQKN